MVNTADVDAMVQCISHVASTTRPVHARRVYSYDRLAMDMGASPYRLLTMYAWFPYVNGAYDTQSVSPRVVTKTMNAMQQETSPIIVDIEAFDPLNDGENMLRNVVRACSMWRMCSSREIGLYYVLPFRRYWPCARLRAALANGDDPATHVRALATAMEADDQAAERLLPYVDFVTPECYLPYIDTGAKWLDWQWDTAYSILEATRVAKGKPVRPFVWFRATPGGDNVALPLAVWESSLQWVASLPGVDALTVYHGGGVPAEYRWQDAVQKLMCDSLSQT